jgi:hypothetical protein
MKVQLSVQSILAFYSAVLSTALAVITVIKFLRERPRIIVKAIPITTPSAEGEDTHGVLVRVRRGDDELWEEADIEIRVSNSGAQACQITDVFIETKWAVQQVRPDGLPVVLDPNTSCSVRVQPEYFAPKDVTPERTLTGVPVEAVGVFDGLGKKHCITKANLTALVMKCTELPLRTALYAHRQTGSLVVAFQIRDAGTIVMKRPPNKGM